MKIKKYKDYISGGLADKMNISDIAKKHNIPTKDLNKQLAKGIKVEMEHTNDPKQAEEIALDHLYEFPDYYDRLEKIEENLINEQLDFNIIPTKYTDIKISSLFIINKQDTIYRFITDKDNSYDVYFSLTLENNQLLSNNIELYKYTKSYIPTIYFSLTKRGLDPNNFDKLTNNDELFEVMGKVMFLIIEYINKHNYTVYSIGEVDSKKYKLYSYYLSNINWLSLLEGTSKNYNNKKCYYLINENR